MQPVLSATSCSWAPWKLSDERISRGKLRVSVKQLCFHIMTSVDPSPFAVISQIHLRLQGVLVTQLHMGNLDLPAFCIGKEQCARFKGSDFEIQWTRAYHNLLLPEILTLDKPLNYISTLDKSLNYISNSFFTINADNITLCIRFYDEELLSPTIPFYSLPISDGSNLILQPLRSRSHTVHHWLLSLISLRSTHHIKVFASLSRVNADPTSLHTSSFTALPGSSHYSCFL